MAWFKNSSSVLCKYSSWQCGQMGRGSNSPVSPSLTTGYAKRIWTVKPASEILRLTFGTELWGAGIVICLGRGADLHMA